MPQHGKRRPKRESSTKNRLRLTFPHQLHGDEAGTGVLENETQDVWGQASLSIYDQSVTN